MIDLGEMEQDMDPASAVTVPAKPMEPREDLGAIEPDMDPAPSVGPNKVRGGMAGTNESLKLLGAGAPYGQ